MTSSAPDTSLPVPSVSQILGEAHRPLSALAERLEGYARQSHEQRRWTALARAWIALIRNRDRIPAGEAMVILESRQSSSWSAPAPAGHDALSFEEDVAAAAWDSLTRMGGLLDRDPPPPDASFARWTQLWEDVLARSDSSPVPPKALEELLAVTELAVLVFGLPSAEAIRPWSGAVRGLIEEYARSSPLPAEMASTNTSRPAAYLALLAFALEAAAAGSASRTFCSILADALEDAAGPDDLAHAERLVRKLALSEPLFDAWLSRRIGLVWESERPADAPAPSLGLTGTVAVVSDTGDLPISFLAASDACGSAGATLTLADPHVSDSATVIEPIRRAWQVGKPLPDSVRSVLGFTERRGGMAFEVVDCAVPDVLVARRLRSGPRVLLVLARWGGAFLGLPERIAPLLQGWGNPAPAVVLGFVDAPSSLLAGRVDDLSPLLAPSPQPEPALRVRALRSLADDPLVTAAWESALADASALIRSLGSSSVSRLEGTGLLLDADASYDASPSLHGLWSHLWRSMALDEADGKRAVQARLCEAPDADRARVEEWLSAPSLPALDPSLRSDWEGFLKACDDGRLRVRLARRAIRRGTPSLSEAELLTTIRRRGRSGRIAEQAVRRFLATVSDYESGLLAAVRDRLRGVLAALGIPSDRPVGSLSPPVSPNGLLDGAFADGPTVADPDRGAVAAATCLDYLDSQAGPNGEPVVPPVGLEWLRARVKEASIVRSSPEPLASSSADGYSRLFGPPRGGCAWERVPWHLRRNLPSVLWVEAAGGHTVADHLLADGPSGDDAVVRDALTLLADWSPGFETLHWPGGVPDELSLAGLRGVDPRPRTRALLDLVVALLALKRSVSSPVGLVDHARRAVLFEVELLVVDGCLGDAPNLRSSLRDWSDLDLEPMHETFREARESLVGSRHHLAFFPRRLRRIMGKDVFPEELRENLSSLRPYGKSFVWCDTASFSRRALEHDVTVCDLVATALEHARAPVFSHLPRPGWDARLSAVDQALRVADRSAEAAAAAVRSDLSHSLDAMRLTLQRRGFAVTGC